MTPDDLVRELGARDVVCNIGEARRVLGHVISEGKDDLDLRKPPRRAVLDAIERHFDRQPLEIVDRVRDEHDGFVKLLFRHPDGALTEAVRIPLQRQGRFTACLSSQVGCAMRCAFCATGRLGLSRSLEAWEMVAAFRAVRKDVRSDDVLTPSATQPSPSPDAPRHLSGAVFMGQGEPFHNYDEVIHAATILSEPCGGRIAKEAITISTVGLVPQIRRYAREQHPYRLIVSLTSAIEEKRKSLLPVAGNFSMDEVIEALRQIHAMDQKRVTLAWVLMRGVNDGDDELAALRERFATLPIRVNLIDVNDASGQFERVSDAERQELVGKLGAAGIAVQVRYSGGQNRHAACGMLAAKHLADPPAA